MKNIFVLDACSLIALLTNEKGADVVKGVLQKALETDTEILMHKINFLEVYYYIHKKYNEEAALKLFEYMKMSPIKINPIIYHPINKSPLSYRYNKYKMFKYLKLFCWFRTMFLETPCNTPWCTGDWCSDCDEKYGKRKKDKAP